MPNRHVQKSTSELNHIDPIWDLIGQEARAAVQKEPSLGAFMHANVLNHMTLESAVGHRIAERLHHADFSAALLSQEFDAMAADVPQWSETLRVDLQVVYDRDPACTRFIEPLLYFKGFHALQSHRLAHWLWKNNRRDLALYIQSLSSSVFQTDINPAAVFGKGIFIDHATGLVVGETARIGDNVSILHGVTLGGTGKTGGDRHPKIGNGVLIGAGAKVLGNITVGDCSRIAAGSVVLEAIPPRKTVAGVPARIVGEAGCEEPSRAMDQMFIGIGI